MTTPLITAVTAGIAYGAIRSYFLSKANEDGKPVKKGNPYVESIIFTLVVYLLVSFIMN